MSASSLQPAAPQAALRQAGDLGRRHGRAAVYWQIGDDGSPAAREFYRELLSGIATADPAILGLYAVPDLTARWDYERENLAADLGLADGDPALDQAAGAYLGAAREEFWLEAARLARRRLAPGAGDETEHGTEPEEDDGELAPDWRQGISDPATGLSGLLSERCGTCILSHGDPMHLGPERTAAFIRQVLAERSYVVCHDTLTYGDNCSAVPGRCGYGPSVTAHELRSLAALITGVTPTDAEVIAASCRDPEQFAAVFDRHAPHIHRYLARRAGPQPANDLVAETFLAAFAQRRSYDPGYLDARPWLYGIATNILGSFHREEIRRFRLSQAARPDRQEIPDYSERIVASLVAESARPQLVAALAGLSGGDRDVLLLIAWEDLSYQEVSRALSIPIGTVRSRLHRARTQLRQVLADIDYREILTNE